MSFPLVYMSWLPPFRFKYQPFFSSNFMRSLRFSIITAFHDYIIRIKYAFVNSFQKDFSIFFNLFCAFLCYIKIPKKAKAPDIYCRVFLYVRKGMIIMSNKKIGGGTYTLSYCTVIALN